MFCHGGGVRVGNQKTAMDWRPRTGESAAFARPWLFIIHLSHAPPKKQMPGLARSASSACHRAAVLSTWRDYLELLQRLPPAAAAERKAEAAAQVRAAATAPPDSPAAANSVKTLMAAVATLRATTARRPGEKRTGRGGVFVLRRGELVQEDNDSGGERRCVVFLFACTLDLAGALSFLPAPHTPHPHAHTHSAVGAGRLSMGEAIDRHRSLLRRQHFGRDPTPGTRLF